MKSRSNSAFLVFVRALFLAALIGFITFMCEVFTLGLMPVFASQLTRVDLWVLPAVVFVFEFLWELFRNSFFHVLLSLGLVALVIFTFSFHGPALISRIFGTFIDSKIDLQRYVQADNPEFENTWLLADSPFPIYYVDDGDLEHTIPRSTLDALAEYVHELPEVLLKNCSAMYLMEEQAFAAMDPDYEDASVFGVSKSSNFTVNIRLVDGGFSSYTYMHDGTPVTLDNPKFYTETIIHELVHLADMKTFVNGTLASASEPFDSFYKEDPQRFGDYGATSNAEWFAEAGVYYFMYPDLLEQEAPEIYQALDDFFTGA